MAMNGWMVGMIALSAIALGGVAAHTALTHTTGADPCVQPGADTNGVPPGPPSWLNATAPHGPPCWETNP